MRLVLAVALVVLACACSDDREAALSTVPADSVSVTSADTSSTKTEPTAAPEISEEDLAAMIPTRKEFELSFHPAEARKSLDDNEEAAEESLDPNDTSSTLEAAGRVSGYRASYYNLNISGASYAGPVELATTVHVFRDEAAAGRFVEDWRSGIERLNGKKITWRVPVTVADVEAFNPGDLGEEAAGVRYALDYGFQTLTYTAATFRVKNLVASASMYRLDRKNMVERVKRLARHLERHVENNSARTDDVGSTAS